MIGIIDYGMGNLGSVTNACRFLELDHTLITRPAEMASCRGVVLPGVGAFGDCMRHLTEHGFVEPVRQWISDDRPFLGICLGLQVLFEGSDESPGVTGLGVFSGRVKKFPGGPGLKVPQMGWNSVHFSTSSPLFQGVPQEAYFYFVHSFYVDNREPEITAGETVHGIRYTSAVARGHVTATQFHPEKSQQIGLQILRNFGLTLLDNFPSGKKRDW